MIGEKQMEGAVQALTKGAIQENGGAMEVSKGDREGEGSDILVPV
jgi:hypothetical protein